MALTRLTIDGYGQIELNNASFPRTGNIEAQCGLESTFTATAPCENGMLLAVDKANKEVKLPAASETLPIGINYSAEKDYRSDAPGHKNFCLAYDANGEYFFPRIGFLSVGEVFTTNCLCADIGTSADFASEAAVTTALKAFKTTAVFGAPCTLGAIQIVTTKPTSGIALQVVEYTTMPDGQSAVKFQVVGL